ncbi:MAG: GspE/PulE family protein [Thermodesulfobacteriota bacterium]
MLSQAIKFDDFEFRAEVLRFPRWPGLRLGAREVYYADIERLEELSVNGRPGAGLTLILKDGGRIRLRLASDAEAAAFRAALGEILEPAVLKDERPRSLDDLEATARDLAASKGANYRKALDFLIAQALAHQASDLNLEPGPDRWRVWFKIDGTMFPAASFSRADGDRLINCLKVAAGLTLHRRDLIQEGRISRSDGREVNDARVSILPSAQGERVGLRLFDRLKGASDLADLGFDRETLAVLERLASSPQGLFLVSGPAGSGKTTTLYALLRRLQASRGRLANIISLEDPIEYRLAGVIQVQVNLEGGPDLARALKSSLRQDPAVIMVGEIRDPETAETAVQAALTGHLVLSAVHCGSAAETVARLLDLGVRPALLASVLLGASGQRLIRRVCPACRPDAAVANENAPGLGRDSPGELKGRGPGCSGCRGTGYRGRQVMAEVMINKGRVIDLIAAAADTRAINQAARAEGLTPLLEQGLKLADAGLTDLEEIRRVVG